MTTSKHLAWLMATAVALGTAAPALAQTAAASAAYQQRLDAYGDQRAAYNERSADYAAQQRAYERDRAKYERARLQYDRRYGSGAYDRRYPQYATQYQSPTYRDSRAYYAEQQAFERDRLSYESARRDYDRRYGTGAYDRRNPTAAARFTTDGRQYGDNANYGEQRAQFERDRLTYESARRDYDRRYGTGAYDRRNPTTAARFTTDGRQYGDNANYGEQRAQFERDRAAYESARRDYDRLYGTGAYDRRNPTTAGRFMNDGPQYGDNTNYGEQRAQYERDRAAYEVARRDYDRRYGVGAYDRYYPDYAKRYAAPYADGYGANASANANANVPCTIDPKRSATAGGVIGALVGAVAGSNLAARNAKTEGAVLGALVGAGLGGAIGNASAKAKCDTRGAYWSYDETTAYRESDYRGQPTYNSRVDARCRLAPAPTEYEGRVDTRYVRVCPDADGRYRVEG